MYEKQWTLSLQCMCMCIYVCMHAFGAFSVDVICFLKLLLVCIFRLSCFLLVRRSLLARFPEKDLGLRGHEHAAEPPSDEWPVSRGMQAVEEAEAEATREQSGEKLKLKGFVQLCSPKCWRACRSSNVPVKMCAPRRDKIMWLKLTTSSSSDRQRAAGTSLDVGFTGKRWQPAPRSLVASSECS